MREKEYVYPIGVVQRLTGLTARQIRYYEKAGLISPGRTRGGHRLYSQENVDVLLQIRSLRENGFASLESVRRAMASNLNVPTSRGFLESRGSRLASPGCMGRDPSEFHGDALIRLMKPVVPGFPPPERNEHSDSQSYFRRGNLLDPARKRS